jgi:hypothetical protein
MRKNRGEQRVLLLIFFECVVCLFIWWRGVVIALGDQPRHRRWDMVQRQRWADWARNELQQRPVWWVMLSGLLLLVLADWFTDKWLQPPWRAAILLPVIALVQVGDRGGAGRYAGPCPRRSREDVRRCEAPSRRSCRMTAW